MSGPLFHQEHKSKYHTPQPRLRIPTQASNRQILFYETPHQAANMSEILTPMIDSSASITPSTSTSSRRRSGTLRERCGFTLWLSFAPAFPCILAKGPIGPTAGNLPRRKRSSVVSLDLPAPVDLNAIRTEYFS
ncbi:hypothetical protein B0H17DRAFT_1209695 [Mycena rosella]|uniref:Uncharacterized protein n=1 Tax=Mycena rosella TaxID=1033263 RepID=A0AAD7CY96_MYCRO|nr:hypothetical protein B0H17DRAFT_1209695 [Mycena rosella]